ncbi:MAG TPA: hypothetical protein VF520_05900 [Thermoleophilaceae bacterium]|jgi:hypothetical protein
MLRTVARLHATLAHALHRLRSTAGQGTVEYVALILLVALVMAGVVAAMKGYKTDQGKDLGDAIVGKIKDAVRKVQF